MVFLLYSWFDNIILFSGTLLTTTVFLHCIDAKLNHNEAINNLQILQNLDYQRAGYYNDLISKWCIEEQLPIDYSSNCLLFKPKMSDKLTCLPHLQYYSFCEEIDLSNQNLCSKVLPSLILLQHCKVLFLNIYSLKSYLHC